MLYFAPINLLSNYVYRHLLLKHGADLVFSELIKMSQLDKEIQNNKFDLFPKDLPKTIFQIGVSSPQEVTQAVELLTNKFDNIYEININMGCPQSSMQQTKVCSGILFDKPLMKVICQQLTDECKKYDIIPSVKLRLGLSPEQIEITTYLDILRETNIQKVYIHARTLLYNYLKPAMHEKMRNLDFEQIIVNGDIDSYNATKKMPNYQGILIARAALSNPFIFEQIKNKQEVKEGPYNPLEKDPNIIQHNTKFYLTQKKHDFIVAYLDLAEQENLRRDLVRANLMYLLKGISGAHAIMKLTNKEINYQELKEELTSVVYHAAP